MNTIYHFMFAQCTTEAHIKERQTAVLSRATKSDQVQKAARALMQRVLGPPSPAKQCGVWYTSKI